MSQAVAVILAAGKGTRMNATDKNKVVLSLNQKPMISYTVDTLTSIGINQIVVVVGFQQQSVKDVLGDRVTYAIQEQPLGTGDAVKASLPQLQATADSVLVMSGDDSAFYTPELFQKLLSTHEDHQNQVTVVSIVKPNPQGLGRIMRDDSGKFIAIVEEKNATEEQRQISEINTGLYCFDKEFLSQALNKLEKNPVTLEYYLTDVIKYAHLNQKKAEALLWNDNSIWHGVNTAEELKIAETSMKQKNEVE